MDVFILERIVEEMKEIVLDSSFRQVSALPDNTISIGLKSGREIFYFIASASSQFPRIYIDNKTPFKPTKTPFTNALDLHLDGARLVSISQITGERIIECIFEKETLWGEKESRKLIIEIMGRHSNIILCKDDVIIDSIKRIDSTKSRVRQILPGLTYQYPPKKEVVPFCELEDHIESFSDLTLEEFLVKNVIGIGSLSIEEIANMARLDKNRVISSLNIEELESFRIAIKSFREKLNNILPVVYLDNQGNPKSFYIFPLSFEKDRYEIHDSVISASARYYNWIIPNLLLENRKKSLIKELKNQIESLKEKRCELEETLTALQDPDKWKLYGDILLSFNSQIPPGSERFSIDWEGERIEISLDPEKTPVENALEYYDRYKEERKKREVIPSLISEIDGKIEELNKRIEEIDKISSIEELDIGKTSSSKKETLPFLVYNVKGYEVWVGKNAKSNELITFKLSSPSDIWFHAKGYSGSHVILRTNGKRLEYIPEEVILESARLAVQHSRARSGTKVPVDYTYRRNVKGAGRKRGSVFYTNYKTILV